MPFAHIKAILVLSLVAKSLAFPPVPCTSCEGNTLTLLFGKEDEKQERVNISFGISAVFHCNDPGSTIANGRFLINSMSYAPVEPNDYIITLRFNVTESHDDARIQCVADLESSCQSCGSNVMVIHVTGIPAATYFSTVIPTTMEAVSKSTPSTSTEKIIDVEAVKVATDLSKSTKIPPYGIGILVIATVGIVALTTLALTALLLARCKVVKLQMRTRCRRLSVSNLNDTSDFNASSFGEVSNGVPVCLKVSSESKEILPDTSTAQDANILQKKETTQAKYVMEYEDTIGDIGVGCDTGIHLKDGNAVDKDSAQKEASLESEDLGPADDEEKHAHTGSDTQEEASCQVKNIHSYKNVSNDIVETSDCHKDEFCHENQSHGHMESGQETSGGPVFYTPERPDIGEDTDIVKMPINNLKDLNLSDMIPTEEEVDLPAAQVQLSGPVNTEVPDLKRVLPRIPPGNSTARSDLDFGTQEYSESTRTRTPEDAGTSGGAGESDVIDSTITDTDGMNQVASVVIPLVDTATGVATQNIRSDSTHGPLSFSTTSGN